MAGRFFRRGVSKFKFLPAVASLAAPTRSEITAGKDLSPEVASPGNWTYDNSPIDVPDFASDFVGNIGGENKPGSPEMQIYDRDDSTGTGMRTALAKGTTGFMYLAPYGDTSGKRAEVWPCTVISRSDTYEDGNEAAKFKARFSVTSAPNQDAVAPA